MKANYSKKQELKKFGEIVRQFRRGLGISQEELGYAAKLDRTYVGGVERGERNVSLINILRLAEALNTTPDKLFRAFLKLLT